MDNAYLVNMTVVDQVTGNRDRVRVVARSLMDCQRLIEEMGPYYQIAALDVDFEVLMPSFLGKEEALSLDPDRLPY